jgi:threonine dehydrogenase-like Zn-dependent dehydrogenase
MSVGTDGEAGGDAVLAPHSARPEAILDAVRYWPAWRAVAAACLEIGSRLLVIGDDGVARDVLVLSRLKGCLWHACLTGAGTTLPAEYIVDTESGLDVLPGRPDAVIVTAAAGDPVAVATRACADRGTVVVAGVAPAQIDLSLYPDVHRRGLRLVAVGPSSGGDADGGAFARLVRLVELGLIAAGT